MPETVKVDLSRVDVIDDAVAAQIEDLFQYHTWDDEQRRRGAVVRDALMDAYRALIEFVPPCPTRTRALNKIVDARMDANAAITHKGKY